MPDPTSDQRPPLNVSGSICAIVTPFTAAGEIDLPAFHRLLDWHRAAGTDGIVVGGSTGESAALEDGEFEMLLGAALSRLQGRATVIAGCGAASTRKALKQIQRARIMGADAALVVTPYYVRPTQDGLLQHYALLADQGQLPLIVYNVPARTGCDLLPETLSRLLGRANIVAVKEARNEPERMEALLQFQSAEFAVFSGDDPTALRALLAGAVGVISVAANVVPRAFRSLCRLARGNPVAARELDRDLQPVYQLLGAEPNPIPAKWLLQELGLIDGQLRLPLVPLSDSLRTSAASLVKKIAELERDCFPNPGERAA